MGGGEIINTGVRIVNLILFVFIIITGPFPQGAKHCVLVVNVFFSEFFIIFKMSLD